MFVRGFNAKCGNSDVILKDSRTVVRGKFTISALKVLELVSVAGGAFSFGSACIHSKGYSVTTFRKQWVSILYIFTLFFDKVLICGEESQEGCGYVVA